MEIDICLEFDGTAVMPKHGEKKKGAIVVIIFANNSQDRFDERLALDKRQSGFRVIYGNRRGTWSEAGGIVIRYLGLKRMGKLANVVQGNQRQERMANIVALPLEEFSHSRKLRRPRRK